MVQAEGKQPRCCTYVEKIAAANEMVDAELGFDKVPLLWGQTQPTLERHGGIIKWKLG